MFQREFPSAPGRLLPPLGLTKHRTMSGTGARPCEVGQKVWARSFDGKLEWLFEVITKPVGQRSSNIQVKDRPIRRHIDHMRHRETEEVKSRRTAEITPPAVWDAPAEECTPVVPREPAVASRDQVVSQSPQRARRPPSRYKDFIKWEEMLCPTI